MNTLTIPEIFSNFDYYQTHYLAIIADAEQYHTPVQYAYIDLWPVGRTDLYLGDLLQLWFSEKWLINSPCLRLFNHPDDGRKIPFQREQDLYLYQLAGSALSGSNRSQVWSRSEQQFIRVIVDSPLKYYGIYKGTDRFSLDRQQLLASLKSAI